MNYKELLKKILVPNKKGINRKLLNRILYNKEKYINIFNFLLYEVYTDSSSLEETLKRLVLNIDKKPLCPICNKPVNFIGKQSKMFSKYCSYSCRAKDPKNYSKWIDGQKKYNEKEYGVTYVWQREDVKEKRKEKLIEKYGTTNLYNVPEIKEKINKTVQSKHNEIISNRNKTLKEKYGIENVGGLLRLPEIQEKINNTKKKNHTFNSSKVEEKSYQLLCSRFNNNVKYQYKSNIYPFVCDFYIPVIDAYIECNYHWTHGGHLFNENSKEDKEKLEFWKSKNSKYYDNAIHTWTIRDVNKHNIALENKLNYFVFYSYDELKEWVNNLDLTIWYDDNKIKDEFDYYLTHNGNLNNVYPNSYIIRYFQQNVLYKTEKELWRNEKIKNKLIENRIKYIKPFEELTDIDYINGFKRSMIYYGYSYFNPLWFKWFIEKYNIKKCYDPFGGWGHRLLGGMSSLDLYIYNDLSKSTYENVNKIISFFNIDNVVTYNEDAGNFIPGEEFDSMFTCPPYYNVEKYECGEFENIEEYNKLIDKIFDIFYSTDSCKIFGIIIREDLLKDEYKEKCTENHIINNRKSHHILKEKKNNEYLYIFMK